MNSPMEFLGGLTIGTVESVSPDSITILLDTEAPQSSALNTGTLTGFPRINGYVLIPGQTGSVVGLIAWLGVERSSFPKRTGLKDFGLIDLPYPLRKIRVTPVGVLRGRTPTEDEPSKHRLERGVKTFPSVGDTALLPTPEQLRAIVESTGKDRRVKIGRSPLADDAEIAIDPDKFFGRHAAILGNTGSGKSCTVAGLIRWSLEAASRHQGTGSPAINARFVILDPNGEYSKAFKDLQVDVDLVEVVPEVPEGVALDDERYAKLLVPAWMWNSQEWFAFTSASPRAQQPMLLQALQELRAGSAPELPPDQQAIRTALQYQVALRATLAGGPAVLSSFPAFKGVHNRLSFMELALTARASKCQNEAIRTALEDVVTRSEEIRADRTDGNYLRGFAETDIESILDALAAAARLNDGVDPGTPLSDPDAPIEFPVGDVPGHLEFVTQHEESGSAAQFVSFLTVRIRTMLGDRRIRPLIDSDERIDLAKWLRTFMPDGEHPRGRIAVINLSLVPSDVLHVVTAAVARLLFEAIQRHRKSNKSKGVLPTVLVLEEAHSFVHSGSDDPSGTPTPTQLCRRVFERIAREGRKFGLGLVLSSQRPSELSPTVLSQCNTFLLHRLVNDRDQEYVSKLVPDLMADLLKDLPSLPSQYAILLGWASPVPKLVRIADLPKEYQPDSADPPFWDVWTRQKPCAVDWHKVIEDWTGETPPAPGEGEGQSGDAEEESPF